MPPDLKVEIGFAVLALIQIVTTILRESWARERAQQTREAIVKVEESLRPGARSSSPVELVVEGDQTPVTCRWCGHAASAHDGGLGQCMVARCDCLHLRPLR